MRPVELRHHAGKPQLSIALPGVSKEEVSVAARGKDLVLRVRDATRLVALPDSLVGRPVKRASLQNGALRIDFE